MVRILFFISVFFLSGCATLNKYYMHNHSEYGLEESDIRKIHDFGWMTECYEKRIELKDSQIKDIEKYGINVAPEDRFVNYIRVIRKKSAGKTGGNVFFVKGNGEFGNYELLACIHKGLINEIYVRKNPKNDEDDEVINKDFLNQFIGRTLDQSLELRETPDDYLITPVKLASIKNAPVTSKNIARNIKIILAIAKVLKL